MIELNAQRLAGLGFGGLTKDQVNSLLQEMYKAGEEIVGLKLASRMSEDELDAFGEIIDEGDDASALKWLELNRPDFREITQTTFEELDEILRAAAARSRGEDRPPAPAEYEAES